MIANERIRAIREFLGCSRAELARRAGLGRSTITQLEENSRPIRTETLQRIAAAFNVKVSYLLGEEDARLESAQALARQSLKLFLEDEENQGIQASVRARLWVVSAHPEAAPRTVTGWARFYDAVTIYEATGHRVGGLQSEAE